LSIFKSSFALKFPSFLQDSQIGRTKRKQITPFRIDGLGKSGAFRPILSDSLAFRLLWNPELERLKKIVLSPLKAMDAGMFPNLIPHVLTST
jgi:hypothetical protein